MRRIWMIALVLACGPKQAEPMLAFRRDTPPPLPVDDRPISFVDFPRLLNPRHPDTGVIHVSEGGGCHYYVQDGESRPPGKFPPARPLGCPDVMRASEWAYCVGAGTISANVEGSECICQPGDGDPPPKPFRIPCPR